MTCNNASTPQQDNNIHRINVSKDNSVNNITVNGKSQSKGLSSIYNEFNEIKNKLKDTGANVIDSDFIEYLIDMAKFEYENALNLLYNPFLDIPVVEYNPRSGSPFYINPDDNWKVHLNVAFIPLFLEHVHKSLYIRTISYHEISHYLICPNNLKTSLLMLHRAKQVTKDERIASMINNIVSDIIIDVRGDWRLHGTNRWLDMISLMEISSNEEIQPILLVMLGVKCNLWQDTDISEEIIPYFNRYLKKDIRQYNSILDAMGLKIPESMQKDINTISDIIRKNIFNMEKWPDIMEPIAKILLKYFNNIKMDKEQLDQMSKRNSDENPLLDGGNGDKMEELKQEVAEECESFDEYVEIVELIESIEKKNEKKARGKNNSDNKDSNKKSDNNSSTDKELESLIDTIMDDANIDEKEAREYIREMMKKTMDNMQNDSNKMLRYLRYWYRQMGKDLLKINYQSKSQFELVPDYSTTWSIGDPIDNLDIYTSFSVFPRIIPGVSTRKWHMQKIEGQGYELKNIPDLLIIIDSSGSMNWNNQSKSSSDWYHIALIGAFALVDMAIKRNVNMAAINFSNGYAEQTWTNDRVKIENTLLQYMGNGTNFPTGAMKKLIEEHNKNYPMRTFLIVIITDAGISNFKSAFNLWLKVLKKNFISFFFIGDDVNINKLSKLREEGAQINIIKEPEDLTNIIIENSRSYYS